MRPHLKHPATHLNHSRSHLKHPATHLNHSRTHLKHPTTHLNHSRPHLKHPSTHLNWPDVAKCETSFLLGDMGDGKNVGKNEEMLTKVIKSSPTKILAD